MLSMAITFVAMLVPLASYKFEVVLVAFALLGIGNTILQVSLNPLSIQCRAGRKAHQQPHMGTVHQSHLVVSRAGHCRFCSCKS